MKCVLAFFVMLKCGYHRSQFNKNKKDNGRISSKSDTAMIFHTSFCLVYFVPAGSGLSASTSKSTTRLTSASTSTSKSESTNTSTSTSTSTSQSLTSAQVSPSSPSDSQSMNAKRSSWTKLIPSESERQNRSIGRANSILKALNRG